MTKISAITKSVLALGAATLLAASANAAFIVGTANLTFGQVSISLGEIDWNPPLNPGLDAIPTYGAFTTAGFANTLSFANPNFAGLTAGLIQDMSNNPLDANYMPLGPQLTPNFIKFAAEPNWQFNVNNLIPGNIVGSPFTLTQLGNNVSATISVNGQVCDAGATGLVTVCDATDDISDWTGVFSAQYTNTTIPAIIAFLVGGGTLANNTWSGTIEAFTPEPGSLALVGLALAGLGLGLRRKSA